MSERLAGIQQGKANMSSVETLSRGQSVKVRTGEWRSLRSVVNQVLRDVPIKSAYTASPAGSFHAPPKA